MKIWLVNLSAGTLNILDMLDELNCEVKVMYAISNHTPQWLSCSDEAFVKVEITHPELILTAFDEDEFEAAANAADVVNAVIGLDKYSRLAMLYMTP